MRGGGRGLAWRTASAPFLLPFPSGRRASRTERHPRPPASAPAPAQVLNAQRAGAAAAIVVDDEPGGPFTMGGGAGAGDVTIPALMISMEDGRTLEGYLAADQVPPGPRPRRRPSDASVAAGGPAHCVG